MLALARPLRSLVVLLIVVAALGPVRVVSGQGTSGSFPGPISSSQLEAYANRLELSASQRLAMEAAHDGYRAQFRELRDGQIADFLRRQGAVQGGIPQRDVVTELLDQFEDIQAKITLLDNGLFDQLLPILSGEQQRVIPRLRLERERAGYRIAALQGSMGRRTADLSEAFLELDLAPDVFEVADATMATYERRLTTIMRKQHKAFIGLQMDMVEELSNRGFTDLTQEALLADPKILQDLITEISEIMPALQAKAAGLADDVRSLNARTCRQIVSVVPASEARRFRVAYYRGDYASLAGLATRLENDWMAKAMELDSLTSPQREMLEPVAVTYGGTIDRLLAQGVERVNAFWEGFSPFDVNPERGNVFRDDLGTLVEKAAQAETTAVETLDQQLGSDVVAKLREAVLAAATPSGPETETADAEPETDEIPFARDQFLPERISHQNVRAYAKQLQLDEGMIAVLDELHADYRAGFAELDVFEQLRAAKTALTAETTGDADMPTAGGDPIDRVMRLRRQALATIAEADGAFFDDVRSVIGDEHEVLLERVRGSRMRQINAGNASDRLVLGANASNESQVDLVAIVLETKPTTDEMARMNDVLTAYEDSAAQAFQARLDAQLEMQRLSDQWLADLDDRSREDLVAVVEMQLEYRETMRAPTERVTTSNQRITELNRQSLELLMGTVDADRAYAIRTTYEQAAFPSVFDDPASVRRHLIKAVALDDLTREQRERLADLDAMYGPEYERLSREMMKHLSENPVTVMGIDPATLRAWQERQQQFAKISFDRNELNGRAISRLRTVLTPPQIVRIGGLPEPLAEDEIVFLR